MKRSFIILISLFIIVRIFAQTTWSLTGNAGTKNSDFLGTTDNRPLIIKVNNNQWAGFTGYQDKYNVSFGYLALSNALTGQGDSNTALGAQALRNNTTGVGNVAVGRWALEYNTTGSNNVAMGFGVGANQPNAVSNTVAIGSLALRYNAKNNNTAVGFESGLHNTQGEALTAVGFKSLWSNTTGNQNTALGYNALVQNTKGTNNTAVGAWTLINNTEGHHNTAVGMKSLYSNTTGEYNTAIGVQTLEKNTTGVYNVGLGSGALNQNTTGSRNTAGGTSAMWYNQTGNDNTAFGEEALGGNFHGDFNTAIGSRALWSTENTPDGARPFGHAHSNTAVGYETLREVTTGSSNVGVGRHALRVNNTGASNVAMGSYALTHNTGGSHNVAIGNWTLNSNTSGSYNTAIGFGADVGNENLTNATAIGYGAKATASNQVTIGNSSVTMIRGFVPWTTISDGRVKENVRENVPGLDFINKLRPVTYNLDLDAADNIIQASAPQGENVNGALKELVSGERGMRAVQQDRLRTGFIAQEVEEAAKSIGYDFSGVNVDKGEGGLYGLSYSKFIVPIVKAVQELSEQNEAKDAAIALLQEQVEVLTGLVNKLLDNNYSSNSKIIAPSNASLEQNFPNPFNQSTTIKYTIPQFFNSARIVVADMNGRIFNQTPISGPGSGNVTIEAGLLQTGMYFYSLFVDNLLVDTKKMFITK